MPLTSLVEASIVRSSIQERLTHSPMLDRTLFVPRLVLCTTLLFAAACSSMRVPAPYSSSSSNDSPIIIVEEARTVAVVIGALTDATTGASGPIVMTLRPTRTIRENGARTTVIDLAFCGLAGSAADGVGMPIDPARVVGKFVEQSLGAEQAHELLDLLDRLLASKFLGGGDLDMSSIEASSCGIRFRRRSDGSAAMNAFRIAESVELWTSVDLHCFRERLDDALVERDRLEARAPSVELAPRPSR